MPFEPGKEKTGGRAKGTPNTLTTTVKTRFSDVFNVMQEDGQPYSLLEWAKKNPSLFYPLASKLIPTEVNAHVEGKLITVSTIAPKKQKPNKTGDSAGGES